MSGLSIALLADIPTIVTNGLIYWVDAAYKNCYSSGNTVTELVGSSANGRINGGTITFSDGQGSFSFNGSLANNYISTNLATATIVNTTMQVWANVASNTHGCFFKNGGQANGYSIGIGNGTFEVAGSNVVILFPTNRWIDTGVIYPKFGWNLITLILTANSMPTIYVNTTLIGSFPGIAPLIPGANTIDGTGTYFNRNYGDEPVGDTIRMTTGQIAGGYIYNRILSIDEITQNYNASRARFGQ